MFHLRTCAEDTQLALAGLLQRPCATAAAAPVSHPCTAGPVGNGDMFDPT